MHAVDNVLDKSDILNYLSEIKPQLQKEGVSKLALFGSFSKGETDIYSDIDIAFKLQKGYLDTRTSWDYFDLLDMIKSKITKKFQLKCDLFDLDSSSFIKESILKDLIYV